MSSPGDGAPAENKKQMKTDAVNARISAPGLLHSCPPLLGCLDGDSSSGSDWLLRKPLALPTFSSLEHFRLSVQHLRMGQP